MAVYLGDRGFVELKRDSLNDPITGVIVPDDVNITKNRFSFGFDQNALISGDQIDIARIDKNTDGTFKDLTLVTGATGDNYRAFVHVDKVGGVRLYENFEDAICDRRTAAIQLEKPSEEQNVAVKTRNSQARCVAQVRNFELTTTRDSVDITSIGEEFRRSYANGLISGQGTMECFWDYQCTTCGDNNDSEFAHYLAQLIIRTEQGADFDGFFYLDGSKQGHYVWQEAKCIVTNVAMAIEPTQLIRTRVQFVTTGEIRLKIGTPPAYVQQEDGSLILLENESGGLLQEDD